MRLPLGPDSCLVVDLDDTLYAEIDFVASGFRAVARMLAPLVGGDLLAPMWRRYRRGENAFAWAAEQCGPGVGVDELLRCYREHRPSLAPGPGVRRVLADAVAHGAVVGVVTDGRSVTQRNKLAALGLTGLLDHVVVSEEIGSEKPDPRNYRVFVDRHPARRFVFVGDNTRKDFVVPAQLGWLTICVRDTGRHIHRQDVDPRPRPDHMISSFEEIDVVAGPAAP
jgi:putative hydrolase of the HAD superfamily